MTLFIASGQGYDTNGVLWNYDDGSVFKALLLMSDCDPNLTRSVSGYALGFESYKVCYKPSKPLKDSSTLLNRLVNCPIPVTIYGVGTSFVTRSTTLLVNDGGASFFQYGDNSVEVDIDVTDAGGENWIVYDNSHPQQTIYFPFSVMLCHELWEVDAYTGGGTTGHVTTFDGPANAHHLFEYGTAGENRFRAQLGLPLRDPIAFAISTGTPQRGDVSPPTCKEPGKTWNCNC
ncbi:hypothetical protein [Mycobacterium sp. 1245852.3]|uniref:hypothetical protein n=1 Tax=Mycobacterium sp. 1245852.3 TaxID=1856860 RepID=UPI0012EA20AE|nr:hypothetical protein [Mycobacterium sp. 1245852.3]